MDSSQLQNIANQYGVSTDAVECLWNALVRGNGSMAQFSHYELGGTGQWMLGGMTMVGDMFNYSAKSRVDGICNALSEAARQAAQTMHAPASSQYQSSGGGTNFMSSSSSANWWPSEFGAPSSVGSQNDLSYAYFPSASRLVVRQQGNTTIYDTLNHQIGGVSQQQGGYDSLTFSSQFGTIRVADLPVVSGTASSHSGGSGATGSNSSFASNESLPQSSNAVVNPVAPVATPPNNAPKEDPIALLERLGKLREAGIVTDEEFATKKAELLSRI